jgi:hypothetical protein
MTWRILADMVEAKRADDWDRTSAVLAMLYNQNRRKGMPAAKPSEFNPFAGRQEGQSTGTSKKPGAQQMDANFNRAMFEALKAAERKQGAE